jgi:hypothetical protein
MSQPELEPTPTTFSIKFADASNLPIHHVNALGLRAGSDEFFLILGSVIPPDQAEIAAATEAGHLVAQPVFRFAISRDTMEKFLALMAGQYDQQTTLIKQLHQLGEETSKEEISGYE